MGYVSSMAPSFPRMKNEGIGAKAESILIKSKNLDLIVNDASALIDDYQ